MDSPSFARARRAEPPRVSGEGHRGQEEEMGEMKMQIKPGRERAPAPRGPEDAPSVNKGREGWGISTAVKQWKTNTAARRERAALMAGRRRLCLGWAAGNSWGAHLARIFSPDEGDGCWGDARCRCLGGHFAQENIREYTKGRKYLSCISLCLNRTLSCQVYCLGMCLTLVGEYKKIL